MACSTANGDCWTEATTRALAVSFTFGGQPQVGEGCGIPLVIRHVLQTGGTAGEAIRAPRRIPVRMSSDWKHSLRRLGPGRIEVKLGSS